MKARAIQPGKQSSDKLTDWASEPTIKDLLKDYNNAKSDHSDYVEHLRGIRNHYKGTHKPTPKDPTRSKYFSKTIAKHAEWKLPVFEAPLLSAEKLFRVSPRSFEDTKRANQNASYLNYQWNVKVDKQEIVTRAARNFVKEGFVVVKAGWEVEERPVTTYQKQPIYASGQQSLGVLKELVAAGKMAPEQAQQVMLSGQPIQVGEKEVAVEVMSLTKNQPSYEVCDNESIVIDPTCNGRKEDIRFIIHIYDTDWSELKKDEYSKEPVQQEDGTIGYDIQGCYKNLDKIEIDTEADNTDEFSDTSGRYVTDFKFNDKSRIKLKAYEYWGYWDINDDGVLVPIVATWVNDVLIRLEENPFPHKQLPFSFASYIPVDNSVRGEPEGVLLRDNQDQITNMTRAINDMVSVQAVGQLLIKKGFFPNRTEKDNFESGSRTVEYAPHCDPTKDIHYRQVDSIDPTTIRVIELNNKEAESISGTKIFSEGIGASSTGKSAQATRSETDAISKREASALRRFSELFKDLGRKTLAMNQAYMSEEEVIRVTNEEFESIKREDIQGEYDISVSVTTLEKDNATAQDLEMLLQTGAASMHPDMSKLIWAKILRLKQQYDLAGMVETFEPKPDPVEEELKQIQLENARLEQTKLMKEIEEMDSRITERVSRTIENEQADGAIKKAKAQAELAKAEKLEAETALINHNFVDEVSGMRYKRENDKLAFDAESKHLIEIDKLKQQGDNKNESR